VASPGSAPRLTGSRIRERRLALGLKQADLARAVGVSPAYLNLIEHNRRRIGGKLVVDLARALGVEPTQLTEGAEEALLAELRDAAARGVPPRGHPGPEAAEDFAGRFPGWAGLVAGQGRRIAELERLVEALSDRLAHDPHLDASLHEVLSAATAIRSAASILAEPDIDPDWRARFLRNVSAESRRLSESAQGLLAWLDVGGDLAERALSPVDELGAFTAAAGYHFEPLERPGAGEAAITALLRASPELIDVGAAELARAMLTRYRDDVRQMPAAAFATSRGVEADPGRLAGAFGVTPDAVLRRIASLEPTAGLVTCDGSGTLTLRKPVDGFALPRFGAACPLWPLYQALARPGQPVEAVVAMPGRLAPRFRCRAISLVRPGGGFDAPPVFEATMLIEPLAEGEAAGEAEVAAGSTCRVCPRAACPARREPSILGDEAAARA